MTIDAKTGEIGVCQNCSKWGFCPDCQAELDKRQASYKEEYGDCIDGLRHDDWDTASSLQSELRMAMDEEYYKPTTEYILVPVKVEYHDATDTLYRFTTPTRDEVQKAVERRNRCPWDCADGILVSENNYMLTTVCPFCKGKR